MSGWHARTAELRERGDVQLVGIIQEQHPERCRLFARWKGLDWPILVDPLNLYGLPVIPVAMAVDENGILRSARLRRRELEGFLEEPPHARPEGAPGPRDLRDLAALEDAARKGGDAGAWRTLGDGLHLWGGPDRRGEAVAAYRKAAGADPEDARAWFRLGVALRSRFDSDGARPGDFREAARAWSRALERVPEQYIWRRRIQQYGPRLSKPYNFYRWVETAREEIAARGGTPVALRVPLSVSEQAGPREGPEAAEGVEPPDPDGRIPRDAQGLVRVETAAVPARVRPGGTIRVHVVLEPAASREAHWDPSAGPATLWIDAPRGWTGGGGTHSRDTALAPRSRRRFELELHVPDDAEPGPVEVPGYTVYPVCEDEDGQCLFLRQDVTVPVRVLPEGGPGR